MKRLRYENDIALSVALVAVLFVSPIGSDNAAARDVEVSANSSEITIYVSPGDPTQIQFPTKVVGGYMKGDSQVSLEKKDRDLVIFPNDTLTETGESFIVRLEDGRSYSVRAVRATEPGQRDDFVTIFDDRGDIILTDEEEEAPHKRKKFDKAPATQVSGLMREMALVSEFGKTTVPGYRKADNYKGQVVLNDGTLIATVDTIFIGPGLWGYVLDVTNLLATGQKLNPATFRLHGTRAISMQHWELEARPISVEQQIARKHSGKVYIVTKAKKK